MEDTVAKSRILSATRSLLTEKAIDKISIREIAGLAKVNVASVNYYFSSKDALFTETLDELVTDGIESWLKINFNPKKPKKADLAAYLEFLHQSCIDEKGFARTRIISLLNSNTVNAANRRIYQTINDIAAALNLESDPGRLKIKTAVAFASLVNLSCSARDAGDFIGIDFEKKESMRQYIKDIVKIIYY